MVMFLSGWNCLHTCHIRSYEKKALKGKYWCLGFSDLGSHFLIVSTTNNFICDALTLRKDFGLDSDYLCTIERNQSIIAFPVNIKIPLKGYLFPLLQP